MIFFEYDTREPHGGQCAAAGMTPGNATQTK